MPRQVNKILISPLLFANLSPARQNFRVQLGPLADELERRGLATFTYSQGVHEVEPPVGWEDYFGARPLYRFLDTRHGDNFANLRRLRHMPHSINAEDAMRLFQDCGEGEDWHQPVWRAALDDVFKMVDDNPEIDAVIGYSEGAMIGASLVVEEAMQAQRTGRRRRIKVCVDAHHMRNHEGFGLTDYCTVCNFHIWLATSEV